MRSFTAIFAATMRELLRQRVIVLPLVLLVFSVLAGVAIDPSGAAAGDADAGAASLVESFAVLAMLIAAVAACGAISEEISHGTVLLLGVRPVRRVTVVLAKAGAVWAFAAGFLVLWSLAFALVLGLRGFEPAVLQAAVEAAVLRGPVVGLIACIGIFASTMLGTRLAFGFTVVAWLVGWFSGQALQLYRGGEAILQLVPGLEPVVHAMTYVVPLRRLDDWAASVSGTLNTSAVSATGVHLPAIYGATSDLLWGLAATAAWLAAAAMAFRLRRSLV